MKDDRLEPGLRPRGRAARFLPLPMLVPLVNLLALRHDGRLGYLFAGHPLAIHYVVVAPR